MITVTTKNKESRAFKLASMLKDTTDDLMILMSPIYYGGLSGESKLYMESFYGKGPQNKRLILVLFSHKPNQEGIAIQEILPWCFKHKLTLIHVVCVSRQTSLLDAADDIHSKIHVTGQMKIEFATLNYLDQKAEVPITYTLRCNDED